MIRPLDEFANLCSVVDEVLSGLGFAREGYTPRWRSERDGRSWSVRFSRDRRTRYAGEVRARFTLGYRLRIDLTTSVRTRLYLVLRSFASGGLVRRIYRWRRLEVLPESPAGLHDLVAVANDPVWGTRLLADPTARGNLAVLSEVREGAGASASVYFEPGSLHYASPRLQPPDVTPDRVTWVVERLTELARTTENLPAPERPATLGRFEKLAKAHPALLAVGLLAGLMATTLIAGLLMMSIAYLVFG